MTGNKNDLIKYRLERSVETLKEGKTMIDNQFWNASVNRIYYACYYSVSAILLLKNIEANTHKGVRQMFGLHFIQTGLISKADGRFFADLYDRRQTGDYDDFISFDKDTAELLYSQAEVFIKKIADLCHS